MSTAHDLSAAKWRTSSYSNGDGGDCVEVAGGFDGFMPVRDSKDPDGPALIFDVDAWTAFISAIKAGELPAA